MTKQQKDLIWLLLQENHYLVKSINARGKEVYKILEGRQIPVQYFTEANVKKIKDFLKTDSEKKNDTESECSKAAAWQKLFKDALYKKPSAAS